MGSLVPVMYLVDLLLQEAADSETKLASCVQPGAVNTGVNCRCATPVAALAV